MVKRRERTRQLIELGRLVVKVDLVELTGDDRATLYGAFIAVAAKLRGEEREEALTRCTVEVGEHLLPTLKVAARSMIVGQPTTQMNEHSSHTCLNLIDTDPETRPDPVIGKIIETVQNEHLARDRW